MAIEGKKTIRTKIPIPTIDEYLGHTYTKKLLAVYIKFNFNWASYILSGILTC